jgi:hypothetical protein
VLRKDMCRNSMVDSDCEVLASSTGNEPLSVLHLQWIICDERDESHIFIDSITELK